MHNYLRGLCDLVGEATVGGIKLDLGNYPGLIPSNKPEEQVTGELYRIREGASEELFYGLDRYEGCSDEDPEPHQYFRHRLDVTLLSDAQVYEAWVYIYNG